MGKSLLVLLSFFVIALLPATSFAVENDTTATETDTVTTADKPVERPAVLKSNASEKVMQVKDAMKEKIADARSAFKEKLQGIKDIRKQNILENLYTRINESNSKKTTQMGERLERLTSILAKVSEMATTLQSEGKSVASLNSLITAANTAIESAKTAVAEQAAKDYTIDISDETTLKTNAREAIKQYLTDIKATFNKVLLAHRAVVKAFSSARTLGGNDNETLTPSATAE